MATELRDQLQSYLGSALTLDRELTVAGMSRAFVATDPVLGRRVVVKAVDPSLGAHISADRFRSEIAALSSLQHSCIVPLLEGGDAHGVPYYTMPAVEGETLRERLVRDGALPVAEAVHVLFDVLSALSHAHGRSVTHGDLRPEQILLTPGHVVTTDFGVVGALLASADDPLALRASANTSLGTPAYSAPEQALTDPAADQRADIYALGLVAYEMLTGEHPFVGRTPSAMLAAHAMEAPVPLSRHRPGTPSALVTIVMQMLAKDPARRPQSADEILNTLQRNVTPAGGMPLIGVRLTPQSRSAEAPRFSRFFDWAVNWRWRVPRHVAAIATAGLVVALGGGMAWRLSGGAEVRSERRVIVVLPFQVAGDPARAYFAEGVSEQVTRRMARLGGVGIVGQATTARYRATGKTPAQLASDLGVTHVLSGTVRWESVDGVPHARIQPELVRVSDSRLVWTRTYDADIADVFRVNADIAEQVVRTAGIVVNGADAAGFDHPPTSNLEAYDLYLRGRGTSRAALADSLRAGIALYARAIDLDSLFALALTATASNWLQLANRHAPAREAYPHARVALDRAIAIDSTIAESHTLLAQHYLLFDWNPTQADRALNRALRVNPSSANAVALRGLRMLISGAPDSAVSDLQSALLRDPLNSATVTWTMMALQSAGRSAEVTAQAQRYLALLPAQGVDSTCMMCIAHSITGDHARMREASLVSAPFSPPSRAYLGYAEARLGNAAAAGRIIRELRQMRGWVNPAAIAVVYAGLGDADAAMPLLQAALADRATDLIFLNSPVWDPVREDARFQALVRRVRQIGKSRTEDQGPGTRVGGIAVVRASVSS